jgi:Tfp pilus assembly protein PilZ
MSRSLLFWNSTSYSLGDDTSLKMEAADHFQTVELSTKLYWVASRKTVVLYYVRLEEGSICWI